MMYFNSIHMDAKNIQFTGIELLITKFIFKHYKDKYNARQLARLLNINHAHANKLCNVLSEKNILIKEQIGNSFYFLYNYENRLSIKFIEYLLSLEEKEFPKWLVVLMHNLNKFNPFIQLGFVFGSSIKNKEFNDIDVFLMYDSGKSKYVKNVKESIRKSDLVEKPIRYVELAEKDVLLNKNNKIFYDILSNNLIFYNPEKYVEVIRKCRK
ncbi:hypothetical protein HY837_00970 [archaeon]|nr:hypothetical protein [archaeon]